MPESELVRAAPRDGIPAITDPVFGTDWSGITVEGYTGLRGKYEVEPRLQPWDEVVGIERDGQARAYPLKLLAEHEVINDTFGDPLLVTFCPLCGSSLTARREVAGRETTFGVSGLLWNWDLVMYDGATDSLRGQIAASERIGPGSRTFGGGRLHPKTRVVGVASGGRTRAYPFPVVEETDVVNDSVGDLPVVVATGPANTASVKSGELFAYDRRVAGRVMTFEAAGDGRIRAGGSTWDVPTGRAVDGPHEGQRLVQAGATTGVYWFAWLEFNPETDAYGTD